MMKGELPDNMPVPLKSIDIIILKVEGDSIRR